jgi:glutamate synthase (NADPH/NADH) small chain
MPWTSRIFCLYALQWASGKEPDAHGERRDILDNWIVQALDYLSLQNRILGGGDTGSDCVGTANRQGALRVTQIELTPKPPEHRPDTAPWTLWPTVLKTSSSHLEGGERLWSVNTKAFVGRDGKLEAIKACRVEWAEKDGRVILPSSR